MCKFRIRPNANHGLNRHLLNPPPPEQGEKFKFKDCGDGRIEAAYRVVPAGRMYPSSLTPHPTPHKAV